MIRKFSDFPKLTRHVRGSKTEEGLSTFSQRFVVNFHTSFLLEDFIIKNLLHETYRVLDENGNLVQKSCFSYQPKKDGSYTYFIKKEAFEQFLANNRSLLKQKVKELENQNEFCDVRYFIRQFKAGTRKLDRLLKAYILEQALTDTYPSTDKNGKTVQKPIFEYKNGHSLIISKKGMFYFVQKHRAELEKMGFQNLKTQLNQIKEELPQNRISVAKLASILKIKDKEKLHSFLTSNQVQDAFVLSNQTGGKKASFVPLVNFHRTFYMLKKEHLPYFVALFSKELLNLGADKTRLDYISGEKRVENFKSEMISLHSFYKLLSVAPTASLNQQLQQQFAKDVFYNAQTKKIEPIFARILQSNKVYLALRSKEAMLSFLKNRRSFFEQQGVSKTRLDVLLGKVELTPWQADYITIYELTQRFKTPNLTKKNLLSYCMDETYVETLETGEKVEKTLFFMTRKNDKGMISYAIKQQNLSYFLDKFGAVFKINPLVQEQGALGCFKVLPVHKGYLHLYQLWDILGRSYRQHFKNLKTHVQEIYKTEQFEKSNLLGKPFKAPVFRVMQAKNRKITLYIDEEAIPQFVKNNYEKLQSLGFKKSRLDLAMLYTPESFVKISRGHLSRRVLPKIPPVLEKE